MLWPLLAVALAQSPLPNTVVSDASFRTAAAACASPRTVAVTSPALWSTLPTFTCSAPLWFPPGSEAAIRPAAGQTVTLSSADCSPLQRCFDASLMPSGTAVTSAADRSVTWLSGSPFDAAWRGTMNIDGSPYPIASCASPSRCTLNRAPPDHKTAVSWFVQPIVFAHPPATLTPVNFAVNFGANLGVNLGAASAAFNAATAALGSGGTLTIPCGNYILDRTWFVQNTYGARIEACGWDTHISWSGDAKGPVIALRGNVQTDVGNFSVSIPSTHPVAGVIEISDSGQTSTFNTFHDIQVQCFDAASGNNCANAILIDGPDANNDFMLFRSVRALGYSHAAALIVGGQSYSHGFEHCAFEGLYGGGTGLYGIYSTSRPGGYAGSFTWDGGGMANTKWDFFIDGVNDDPIFIRNFNNESSGGLIHSSGGAAIFVEGGRFAGTSTASSLVADVSGQNIVFDGTLFSVNGGYSAHANSLTFRYRPLQIGGGPPGNIVFRNTTMLTSNFTPALLLPGGGANAAVFENAKWSNQGVPASDYFYTSDWSAGSISASVGSAEVKGSDTRWTAAMARGSMLIAGRAYNIASLDEARQIVTLTQPVAVAAATSYLLASNPSYEIRPAILSGAAGNTDFKGALVIGTQTWRFSGPLRNLAQPPVCSLTYYGGPHTQPAWYTISGSPGSWVLNPGGDPRASVRYLCSGLN